MLSGDNGALEPATPGVSSKISSDSQRLSSLAKQKCDGN